MHQFGDIGAVNVARMRQRNINLAANASRVCVHDDDSIGQTHRFADGVRDEQNRLARLNPQFLKLLMQQRARLRIERRERFIHQQNRGVQH